MKPPHPYRPGDELNAAELTQTADSAFAGQWMSAAGRAEKINPPGESPGAGGLVTQPYIFARITGKGSGCADSGAQSGNPYYTPPPDNCYCGIQQISNPDGTIEDAEAGLTFDSFAFPLVEMTENPDVPVDAIIMAIPSADLQRYEFVFAGEAVGESGSGCGSGCSQGIDLQCLLRCTPTGLQVQSGCFYVVINGQKFYVQFE